MRPNFAPVQKLYNFPWSSKLWHFESYGERMPPSSGLNFNTTSRSSETLAFALQGLIQNKNTVWPLLCYEISYLTVKCRQVFMDLTVVYCLLSLLRAATSNLSSCFHSLIHWETQTCVVCVHRSFQNLTVTGVTLCVPYQLHHLFIFPYMFHVASGGSVLFVTFAGTAEVIAGLKVAICFTMLQQTF